MKKPTQVHVLHLDGLEIKLRKKMDWPNNVLGKGWHMYPLLLACVTPSPLANLKIIVLIYCPPSHALYRMLCAGLLLQSPPKGQYVFVSAVPDWYVPFAIWDVSYCLSELFQLVLTKSYFQFFLFFFSRPIVRCHACVRCKRNRRFGRPPRCPLPIIRHTEFVVSWRICSKTFLCRPVALVH